MSARKPRKAGQLVYQKPKLRLVPSPEEPKRTAPDPELKEILDRVRRHPAHGRHRLGGDDKDAAEGKKGEVSEQGGAKMARGDAVRVLAGRYEGREGIVRRVLNEAGPDALVQVAFPGGATDYCLMSHLEKIAGSDSPRAEEGGKK